MLLEHPPLEHLPPHKKMSCHLVWEKKMKKMCTWFSPVFPHHQIPEQLIRWLWYVWRVKHPRPCHSPKERVSLNECPLFWIHQAICFLLFPSIIAENNFACRHPWAFSSPRALCVLLRTDRFLIQSASIICSPPMKMTLRALSWAITCLRELGKWDVWLCSCESMCVRSLKGNVSFDFLLITQRALCSVVNCPGPLFSQWETGYGVKIHPPFLFSNL